MKESTIEKAVTAYAKSKGWLSYKWLSLNQRGVPDRLFFKAGKVKLIEFKRPAGKVTPLQACVHRQLGHQGFMVNVVNSIEQGKDLFDA